MDHQVFVRWFLLLGAAMLLVVYAIPLLVVPIRWSRLFRWEIPGDRQLTVYLGRCLGAVSVATAVLFFRVASRPELYSVVLELIIASGALMTLVHVYGALKREQPWTETAEIALYAVFTGVAVWLYMGL